MCTHVQVKDGKGIITVIGTTGVDRENKKVMLKNCAPFINIICV